MRTTIVLDDAVFRQVKKRAQERKTTVSNLIEAALQGELARAASASRRRPFKLVVNKGPGLRPGLSWDTVAREVLSTHPNGLP